VAVAVDSLVVVVVVVDSLAVLADSLVDLHLQVLVVAVAVVPGIIPALLMISSSTSLQLLVAVVMT
jgi:hypothetical protein